MRKISPGSQSDVASKIAPTATGPVAATTYPIDCAMPETLEESPDERVRRPKSMDGYVMHVPPQIPHMSTGRTSDAKLPEETMSSARPAM